MSGTVSEVNDTRMNKTVPDPQQTSMASRRDRSRNNCNKVIASLFEHLLNDRHFARRFIYDVSSNPTTNPKRSVYI